MFKFCMFLALSGLLIGANCGGRCKNREYNIDSHNPGENRVLGIINCIVHGFAGK